MTQTQKLTYRFELGLIKKKKNSDALTSTNSIIFTTPRLTLRA